MTGPDARPQPPYSVLIVEDEALLALDLDAIVSDAGHGVCGEAVDLAEVAAMADEPAPVLALVDMNLADGPTGLEVCRTILRQWPRTVVIFITANAAQMPEDFAGGHGVIAKPFSQSGMSAALKYLEGAISGPSPKTPAPDILRPGPAFADLLAA